MRGVGSVQPSQDVRVHYFCCPQNGGVLLSLIVSIKIDYYQLQFFKMCHLHTHSNSGHTQDQSPNCTSRVQPPSPNSVLRHRHAQTLSVSYAEAALQDYSCDKHTSEKASEASTPITSTAHESLSISFLQPALTLANCLKVILTGPRSGSEETKSSQQDPHTQLVLQQSLKSEAVKPLLTEGSGAV